MVGPSPIFFEPQARDSDPVSEHSDAGLSKADLRKTLRVARNAHAATLDPRVRALVMMRPPAALRELVAEGATIGVYLAGSGEAPTIGYARHFHEAGHAIALPWFGDRDTAMEFRRWESPHLDELLEPGPFGVAQPLATAASVVPDVLFVPLVGFTADGARLGQGGGHYDRWLAAYPHVPAIGLAWDCQLVDALPTQAHDRPLSAVVTPTRLYGPF